MKPIVKWQYEQLLKELLLLQDHQTDPSCPCATGGEMCTRKHLLAIEAYAQETVAMEENEYYQGKLNTLAEEARSHRKEEEEALRQEGEHEDLVEWSRSWRKIFEEYSLRENKKNED